MQNFKNEELTVKTQEGERKIIVKIQPPKENKKRKEETSTL